MGCDASLHARRPSANHVRDELVLDDSVAAMAGTSQPDKPLAPVHAHRRPHTA